MSRIYEIIRRREYDDAAEDDNAPVHRASHHGCRQREKGKYKDWYQVAKGEDVDKAAVAAERPAMWGKRLTTDAFEQNAADCDHVGGGKGADGKGYDGVEGGGGADVYEGKEDGDDEGDDDGVQGNVPAGCDLELTGLLACIERKGGVRDRRTCESTAEKGTPLSRANDHNCREPVATSLMVLAVRVTMRTVHMTFVAL